LGRNSYPGKVVLRGKARRVLELLEEGPKTPSEIYLALGARTESQKRNARKVLEQLREKGLIQRYPPPLCSLTDKGEKVLECLKLLEK